jgi:hypothetical protein
MSQIYFPAPEPYTGPDKCADCRGAGITGERYEFPTGTGPVIHADEICPTCGGCGTSGHMACLPIQHAGADPEEWLDELYEKEPEAQPCPSCHGRRWNPLQGVTDDRVTYLRMPCGCAESLMVPVPA